MTAITFTPLGEGVDMNNTIIVSFPVKSAKKGVDLSVSVL